MKAAHLADKKQAGFVVTPITIIEVPGDNKKGDLLLDGKSNKSIKSFTRGGVNSLRRISFKPGKPLQRTV